MYISQYLNSDEQPCAQEEYTIASAAGADYSRLIVPADKFWARSFYVEQREKTIPKLSFI